MRTLICNGTLILDGNRSIDDGYLVIENKKITGIYAEEPDGKYDQHIDAQGQYIIPGLLDMHTHGAMGHDFNVCSMTDIEEIAQELYKEGVTGFLASLVCESPQDTLKLLKRYESCACPSLIGIHMEGPFLNKHQKAVMKEDCLRNPDMQEFQTFLQTSSKIRSMTIAPELPHALEMISKGYHKGIVMNIGHSDATSEQVLEAQAYGASGITHLYNAMSQHLHRAPGIVTGAVLSNLMCELIVDGFHIHEDIVRATYQMIGRDRIVLISDANPCKGLPDGDYEFSGKHVHISDSKAVVIETGRIAGSTLRMQDACKNMMKYCGCSIMDVVQMAAVNPATQYHLHKGKIELGYNGDIIIVNKDFDLLHVFANDEIIF